MSCAAGVAQPSVGSFSVTPKVGLTMSTLWGDDAPVRAVFLRTDYSSSQEAYEDSRNYWEVHEASVKPSAGFALGVDLQKQFARHAAFSVGAYYAMQSYKLDVAGDDVFRCKKFETKLHYIQLPLQWKFYVAKGLALQTGVQLEFLTGAKSEVRSTINDVELKNDEIKYVGRENKTLAFAAYVSHRSQDPTLDFGLSVPVGMSYEYKRVVAELRCNLPLTRVYNYDDWDLAAKQFKFGCMFTLGYRFELPKYVEK